MPLRSAPPRLWLVLALCTIAGSLSAQSAPRGQVLVLGSFHFANPGRDVVKSEGTDVTTSERQREIASVAAALAAFKPTRIAIERPVGDAAIDSLYAAYRSGTHTLARSETEQLGMRLAKTLGLPRVDGVDVAGKFDFAPVMGYAAQKDPAFAQWMQRTLGEVQAADTRRMRTLSIGAHLREMNEPSFVRGGHDLYLRIAGVGAADGYAGAKLASDWYTRNIHIFANIKKLAAPGERVLVIIGAGHAGVLRELISGSLELELIDPLAYLPR